NSPIPNPPHATPVLVNASPVRALAIFVRKFASIVLSSAKSVLSLARNLRLMTGDRLLHRERRAAASSTWPVRVKRGLSPGSFTSRTVVPHVGSVEVQSNSILHAFLVGRYHSRPSTVI